MYLPMIVDKMSNKGFKVTVSSNHKSIEVSLKNRKISLMEVDYANDLELPRSRMSSTSNGVRIAE